MVKVCYSSVPGCLSLRSPSSRLAMAERRFLLERHQVVRIVNEQLVREKSAGMHLVGTQDLAVSIQMKPDQRRGIPVSLDPAVVQPDWNGMLVVGLDLHIICRCLQW